MIACINDTAKTPRKILVKSMTLTQLENLKKVAGTMTKHRKLKHHGHDNERLLEEPGHDMSAPSKTGAVGFCICKRSVQNK